VRGNLAHPAIIFFKRILHDLPLLSAVSLQFVASSLCSRRRRISKIAWPIFPLAQNDKDAPELFAHYSRFPHFRAVFSASSAVDAFCCFARTRPRIAPQQGFLARDSPNSPGDSERLPANSLRRGRARFHSEAASTANSSVIGLQPIAAPRRRNRSREDSIPRAASSAGKFVPAGEHWLTRFVLQRQAFQKLRDEIGPPRMRDTEQ